MPTFVPIPPIIKHIAHFMKVAEEHDHRNIVVSYWSRMYACESAMSSIVGKKPPEVSAYLITIMQWLEETKREHADVEGISNATVGQAILEEYILKLFNYADAQDKMQNFGKNVIKAFYTCGVLIDTIQQFGTLSDEMFNKRKYAKWKASYIHHCLKIGETPFPGPRVDLNALEITDDEEVVEEDDDAANSNLDDNPSTDLPNSGNKDASRGDPPSSVPAPLEPQSPKPLPVPAPRSGYVLSPEDIDRAQKLCKWAGSALTYDDINTAVHHLQDALTLLQSGRQD